MSCRYSFFIWEFQTVGLRMHCRPLGSTTFSLYVLRTQRKRSY